MTPVERLIYESVSFAHWAVCEGISPVDGQGVSAPDDFLMRYSDATGDTDWETLAFRLARGLSSKSGAVGMIETIPAMRRRHKEELRNLVEGEAERRITQTQAARNLGTTLQNLNNIIQREGIYWPVKAQGKRQ